MAGFHALGIALIAALAPAAQAAQEEGPAPAPAAAPAPATPAAPAVQEVSLDVGGIRARVVLRRGAALEGLLPLGTAFWEKPSPGMDYEEAEASDPAAGLRLYFVLGMEGAIFFRKSDIAEVKDLGVVSDETAAAIRQSILDARRRVIEEKEAQLRVALIKILGTDRVEAPVAKNPAPAAVAAAPATNGAPTAAETASAPAPVTVPAALPADATKEEIAKAKAEARRARGDELLVKYPPPDWSEKRLEDIVWRERVAKVPPDRVEAPFVKEGDLWVEALRRREAAEKKAATPAPTGDGASAGAGNPAPR